MIRDLYTELCAHRPTEGLFNNQKAVATLLCTSSYCRLPSSTGQGQERKHRGVHPVDFTLGPKFLGTFSTPIHFKRRSRLLSPGRHCVGGGAGSNGTGARVPSLSTWPRRLLRASGQILLSLRAQGSVSQLNCATAARNHHTQDVQSKCGRLPMKPLNSEI